MQSKQDSIAMGPRLSSQPAFFSVKRGGKGEKKKGKEEKGDKGQVQECTGSNVSTLYPTLRNRKQPLKQPHRDKKSTEESNL